jgi:hypothetical protein
MTKLEEFKRHLRPGQVYRREELAQWSNAVDRHLKQLVDDGTLTKLAPGLYAYPKETAFGKAPAEDDSLLQRRDVQEFIGTEPYKTHKAKRFRGADNPNIAHNDAFLLSDPETRKTYADAFAASGALYYGDKPTFDQVLGEIGTWVETL